MAETNQNNTPHEEEKEIDLLEMAITLWRSRKKLMIWSVCGAVIGLIIAFSIPKEYSVSVKLAPESNDSKSSGGLGALASIAGLGGNSASGADAVYPMLYPDVVSSVPFMTGLFNVPVKTKEGPAAIPLQEYMTEDISSPWWSVITGLPGKVLGLFGSKDEETDKQHKLDNFQLTKEENNLVSVLKGRISASVDTKTSVISIDVTMQDPLVAAVLADTVVNRLKEYITEYRTNKARRDLEYANKLNDEAKQNYYEAQQRYANYLDHNQGIVFRSAQTVRDRLENEATLAFNLYNQTAQQVQKAQAKIQETTPVYTIITPATVPIRPSKPRKVLILIGFTFLAFISCAAWVLFVQPMVQSHKDNTAKAQNDPSITE